MKSLNFNRKASMLRNMSEEKGPRKKVNWDKIIYFAVVGIIAFLILRYTINQFLYITAQGQVLFNSVKVRIPSDVTVHYFNISEGDTVMNGDTLFAYTQAFDENKYNALAFRFGQETEPKSNSTWREREIYQLNKNIRLNRLRIGENINLIAWYKSEIAKIENQVVLEVSSKSKLQQYRSQLEKLAIENKKYRREIGEYKSMINDLGGIAQDPETIEDDINYMSTPHSGGGPGYMAFKRLYISPLNGVITRIYKFPNEVALKTEPIMNIHQEESVYIKAFYAQEDVNDLRAGDVVDLKFADGTTSQGVIKRFYSATYRMPPEFQKKYEPTTRAIAADIYPANEDQLKEWTKYYKISVDIKKFKYRW